MTARAWRDCRRCGRPHWLAPGEAPPAHRVTDDARLSTRVCDAVATDGTARLCVACAGPS